MQYVISLLILVCLTACGKAGPAGTNGSAGPKGDTGATLTTPVLIPAPSPIPDRYFYVAGTIRIDAATGKWFVIQDDNHSPMHVAKIETDVDSVKVWYSELTAKVVTFVVTPDETYTINGINAGASVGTDYALIEYAKGEHRLTTAKMNIPGANLWFYGIFERKN